MSNTTEFILNPAISMDRRSCIRLLGGGLLISAAMVTTGCQHPSSTTADGVDSATCKDPRYHWLNLASRAPSAHNMQPWQIDLREGPDVIVLYADSQRFLPAVDPESRQSMVSLGAFLELLCLSAQADGQICDVSLFPQGEALTSPVARIRFTPATEKLPPDDLYAYIRQRYSNRRVYMTDRPVTAADLATLRTAATCHGISAEGQVQPGAVSRISARAAAAWQSELADNALMLETLRVTRVGKREIESYRDGIAVQGFWPELAASLGFFPRDRVPAPDSSAMKTMQAMGVDQARSAAGWIWLTSPGSTRSQQLAAGRAYVRLHLTAIQHGIALHPMSQALEKYSAQYQGLYQDLSVSPESHTVQMLARIGYASPESLSLRRGVDQFVRKDA